MAVVFALFFMDREKNDEPEFAECSSACRPYLAGAYFCVVRLSEDRRI
jgi:hypothetical protein